MDKTLISFTSLQERYGLQISRETLRRWCNAGQFPRPITLGGRRVFWRMGDIDAFLIAQGAATTTAKKKPRHPHGPKPKRRAA